MLRFVACAAAANCAMLLGGTRLGARTYVAHQQHTTITMCYIYNAKRAVECISCAARARGECEIFGLPEHSSSAHSTRFRAFWVSNFRCKVSAFCVVLCARPQMQLWIEYIVCAVRSSMRHKCILYKAYLVWRTFRLKTLWISMQILKATNNVVAIWWVLDTCFACRVSTLRRQIFNLRLPISHLMQNHLSFT